MLWARVFFRNDLDLVLERIGRTWSCRPELTLLIFDAMGKGLGNECDVAAIQLLPLHVARPNLTQLEMSRGGSCAVSTCSSHLVQRHRMSCNEKFLWKYRICSESVRNNKQLKLNLLIQTGMFWFGTWVLELSPACRMTVLDDGYQICADLAWPPLASFHRDLKWSK